MRTYRATLAPDLTIPVQGNGLRLEPGALVVYGEHVNDWAAVFPLGNLLCLICEPDTDEPIPPTDKLRVEIKVGHLRAVHPVDPDGNPWTLESIKRVAFGPFGEMRWCD